MDSALAWLMKNYSNSGRCDQQPDLIWIGFFCASWSLAKAGEYG